MSDNKNIDRLFQEKFKDYEVFPEPNVWKGIENELTKKKKSRIIPLWLRYAGVAVILLLLIPIGNWVYNNNNNTPPTFPDTNIITDTDKNEDMLKENQSSDDKLNNKEDIDKTNAESNDNTNYVNSRNISGQTRDIHGQSEDKLISATPQVNRKSTNDNKTDTNKEKIEIINDDNTEIVASEQKSVKQRDIEQHEKSPKNGLKIIENQQDIEKTKIAISENIVEDSDRKSDLIEALETQNTEDKIVDVNDKKWSIGTVAGPVYMNTSSNGSPIDPALANNTKTGNNSISYGLKVNYKITNKFSLQSGIQNVDLGYNTANVSVIASSALLDNSKTNINSNLGATLQVSSTVSQVQNIETSDQSSSFGNRSPFDTSGSLDQSFSYIEVPLEAKYAIVQNKLGVNIVGGFSTYFLYDNDVSLTSFEEKTILGEATNLNNLNFSGNIGLDVNYNLSPNLYINASPMLKYQLNTFSENSDGFTSYFFGVYGGLNFRF